MSVTEENRSDSRPSEAHPSEAHAFQADVAKLLHLMVHSVYSDKSVFLRELIANAADACERLRYEAIAEPKLLGDDATHSLFRGPSGRSVGLFDIARATSTSSASGTAANAASLGGG